MQPVKLHPERQPVTTITEIVAEIVTAGNAQVADKGIEEPEGRAEFQLATDALNYHRVMWRLAEELGEADRALSEVVKAKVCQARGYDPEEFDAALVATRDRPRLPYGWTAMDLARHHLTSRPVRLLNADLEASRFAKGVLALAVHLQAVQKDEPILLPVEQVREILAAKKVVVAGTITRLVDLGLLEVTKAEYHTGSAREYRFRGVEGKDYVYVDGR